MTNLIHAMDHEIKRLQWPIAFATNVICCAAICLTIFFFTFNIRYRNFRYVDHVFFNNFKFEFVPLT